MDDVCSSRDEVVSLRWRVEELDLRRELTRLLPLEEFVECAFLGDTPFIRVAGARFLATLEGYCVLAGWWGLHRWWTFFWSDVDSA